MGTRVKRVEACIAGKKKKQGSRARPVRPPARPADEDEAED